MKVQVNRKAHFNAAHRLFKKDWDDAKNLAVGNFRDEDSLL